MDLSAVLEFVIRRIEQEALRSGQPLSDEQRSLLNDLPTSSSISHIATGEPESLPEPVPRDTNYEKLIAAAKTAYRQDRELNPSSRDWEFSISVLKLNRHPMNWLLGWAGVKQPKPWWDRWLLFLAALIFIAGTMTLIVLLAEKPGLFTKLLLGAGYVALVLVSYLASRGIEVRELERTIEKLRPVSRFHGQC